MKNPRGRGPRAGQGVSAWTRTEPMFKSLQGVDVRGPTVAHWACGD